MGTLANNSIVSVSDYLGRGASAWRINCSEVTSRFSTTVSDIVVGVTYRAYSFFKYKTTSAPALSTLAFSLEKPGVSFSKHDADHDTLITQASPIIHRLTLAEYDADVWYCLISYIYRRDNLEVLQASAVYNVATGQQVTQLFDYQWVPF